MKRKKVFYTELAYILGIAALALGTAFMERADFGLSTVIAPAYLVYRKISQYIPGFTFGMAEYVFQALLLAVMCLVLRSFKARFLFSFVTTVIYGLMLDGFMELVAFLPGGGIVWRAVFFLIGFFLCAVAISLLFHTYVPPEVYELFIKELSVRFRADINRVKLFYDCASCLLAIIMSFVFFGFGSFVGVKLGTVLCAIFNGFTIGACSRLFESFFEFKDAFKLRDRLG